MKPSLDECSAPPASPRRRRQRCAPHGLIAPPAEDYTLYEYHWDGPKRVHVPVWQPRQTTLVVLFEGMSRLFFSTVHIFVYYNKGSAKDAQSNNVWDVQQLGPVTHSYRGHAIHAPLNPSSLPKLTVAFEVGQMAAKTSFHTLVLRSPANTRELDRNAIGILLEHELALTSDTLSFSLSFTHSTMLWTPTTIEWPERRHIVTSPTFRIEYTTTRIVRVLPPEAFRPRITNGSLPTELLIKTFEDAEFQDSWHDDLLSFAQVCRAWSCAMEILHARLSFLDGDNDDNEPQAPSKHLLDLHALAHALRTKPFLGHGFRHLTTLNFRSAADWQDIFDVPSRRSPVARFTAALIAVLRTTKYLQSVHLGQLDPGQADPLFAALYALRDVQTLSIGPAEEQPIGAFIEHHHRRHHRTHSTTPSPPRLLSVVQLARCMARWPALHSLTLHHLHTGTGATSGVASMAAALPLGLWRFALRAPVCRLTQLTLSRSRVADRDLVHLFAASAPTLERVVLDRLEGITNAGLAAFLLAIAPNVVSLTVRDVALPPFRQWGSLVLAGGRGVGKAVRAGGGRSGGAKRGQGRVEHGHGHGHGRGCGRGQKQGHTERALDAVVDRMPRLQELHIAGDVASEFMLDRRSKMYVGAHAGEGVAAHDVVHTTAHVPEAIGMTETMVSVPVVRLWFEDVPRLCGFAADGKWPGWSTPDKPPRR